jgi:hypothetical protein
LLAQIVDPGGVAPEGRAGRTVDHFTSAHYWTALSPSGSGVNELCGLCVGHHLIRRQCRPSIPRELLYLVPWQYLKPVGMVKQSVIERNR